jgi:hypothetical protein
MKITYEMNDMPNEFYEWLDKCPVKIVGRDFDEYVWRYTFMIPIKEIVNEMSEHPADKDDRLYHEEQDHIAMEKAKETK